MTRLPSLVPVAVLALFSLACEATDPTPAPAPFAEVEEAGVTAYLGLAAPIQQTETDGVITHEWDPADGPMCLRGAPYRMATRDSDASDDLLIFLGGGGACWSDFCFAFEEADGGMPPMQALDPQHPTNPFRTFDVAYLSYCDGSLFAGDVQYDDDEDGVPDRFHYGLKNLSVALDVVAERYPAPDRIVLAGASGGGYGTIVATILVRAMYPDHVLHVVNDSGLGIAKGPDDTGFVNKLFEEFNARRFLPQSCPECLADGHLTGLVAWQLEQDPNLKIAAFSYLRDIIIGTTFLGLDGPDFEAFVRQETKALSERFEGRYVPFLVPGGAHTALAGDISVFLEDIPEDGPDLSGLIELGAMDTAQVDQTTFAQWLQLMLDDSPLWTPRIAPEQR